MNNAMNSTNLAQVAWARLSPLPGGKRLFSRIISWKAPYFRSIRPVFVELRPGYCEVRMHKRHAVLNHIGTIHAIALCNLAEVAGGIMTEITVPPHYRWIPKGMSVEYLAKAPTDVKAIAKLVLPQDLGESSEVPAKIHIEDVNGQVVFRAVITMHVSLKPHPGSRQ